MRTLALCLFIAACGSPAGRNHPLADGGFDAAGNRGDLAGADLSGSPGGGDGDGGGGGNLDGGGASPDLARNCLTPNLNAFNLDVQTVTLSGQITVNHAPVMPGSALGGVYLKNSHYDQVELADLKSGSYSLQVVPDTYEVHVEIIEDDPASNLPRNYDARIAGPITITASTTLDIDIPATTVSGTITLNHPAPPASGSDGDIELRDPTDSSNFARVGNTLGGSYSALVAPGTYDVYYVYSDGDVVPRNYQAKLKSGVVVGSSPVTVDVDIPSVPVMGAITIAGQPPPSSATDYGHLYFESATDLVPVADTKDQSYAIQVVSGTYDIYYQSGTSSDAPTSAVPRNFRIYLRKGVSLTSATTLDLDIPAATLKGTFRLNGAAPPAASGSVELATNGGDSAFLGKLEQGSYTQLIAPGTYDLYYIGEYGGGPVADSFVRIQQGVVVQAGTNTLDIDVVTHNLSGTLTLNGAPPPASASAKISLRDTKTGDQVTLGDLAAGHYSVQAVGTGTYDLYYEWKSGSGVPINTAAILPLGRTISSGGTYDFDIPAVAVSGQMTFNGAPVTTAGEVCSFTLYTPGAALLGGSSAVSYSVLVLPGIYDVVLQYQSGTSVVPHDMFRTLYCAHVGL